MVNMLEDIIGSDNVGNKYLNVQVPPTLTEYTDNIFIKHRTYGSWISFGGLGNDYTLTDLIGYGFDVKCGTCNHHYSLKFETGNSVILSKASDLNGEHYILEVGIEDSTIVDGTSFCSYLYHIIQNEFNNNTEFVHTTGDVIATNYGYENEIFWVYDSRYMNSTSKDGRLYSRYYKPVDHVEVTYTGDYVLFDSKYDKNDVIFTAYYQDGTDEILPQNEFSVDTLIITKKPIQQCTAFWNESYYQCFYEVPVLYPLKLELEYAQKFHAINTEWDRSSLTVTLRYNNSDFDIVLSDTDYTVSTEIVANIGPNTIVVKDKTFKLQSSFDICGIYIIIDMESTYKGAEIEIGQMYNPNDIEVIAHTVNGNIKFNYNKNLLTLPDGEKITNDFVVDDDLTIHTDGLNTKTVYYKCYETEFIIPFYITGTPKLLGIEAKIVGDTQYFLGDRVSSDSIQVTGRYLTSDIDNTTEIRIIDSKFWSFKTLPLITDDNHGEFVVQYKGFETSITVPYIEATTDSYLNVWYEGLPVKVGDEYNLNNVFIYLITKYADGRENRIPLDYKKVSFNSRIIYKEGWNFFTVSYTIKYITITQTLAVKGYIPFEHEEVKFKVVYIDKEHNNEEVDYTKDFYNGIIIDGHLCITWNAVLNVIINLNKYGEYILTAPKKTGLSNEYATDWFIRCYDKHRLKATIQKIYKEKYKGGHTNG